MSQFGKIWAEAFVLVFLLVFSSALGQYGGGMGTAGEPYEIGTAEHLIFMGGDPNNWDKHFILTADIDLGVYSFTEAVIAADLDNTNNNFDGTSFTGVFDGAGHQVMNLMIDGGDNDFLGLFGMIGDAQAQVKNLSLENFSIVGTLESEYLGGLCGRNYGTISRCYANGLVRGGSVVGGLCGHNRYGTISQCGAEGSVRGRRFSDSVGGLCGQNFEGTITRCYANGSVSGADHSTNIGGLCGTNVFGTISQCYATGSVSGGDFSGSHGGLCGGNYQDSKITDCYAAGSVTGGYNSWYIGGFCGFNQSATITNCYATGAAVGGTNSQYIGGFCGDNFRGEIRRCFFDVETGGPVNGLGRWQTTASMQMASTFIGRGWDFLDETANGTDDIWYIYENVSYPLLRWQNHLPVADAGEDQRVYADPNGFAVVTLDGSGSFDTDGDDLTYHWSWDVCGQTFTSSGSGDGKVNLLDFAELAKGFKSLSDLAKFSAAWLSSAGTPNYDLQFDAAPDSPYLIIELPVGVHEITLVVKDGIEDSESDAVVVTVLRVGDLDGDGEVDMDDLAIVLAGRNTPADGPDDPRDLDGDGMITVLDARILVTLFTD